MLRIHIIQKGDTLATIANHYGVDYEILVKQNPQIADPDSIAPGMKLTIPQESLKLNKANKKETRTNDIVKEGQTDVEVANGKDEDMKRPIGTQLEDDGKPNNMYLNDKEAYIFRPIDRPISTDAWNLKESDEFMENGHNEDIVDQQIVREKHTFCSHCHRPMYKEALEQEPMDDSSLNGLKRKGPVHPIQNRW